MLIFLSMHNFNRCGFSKVSHVDDIDGHFPDLDVNDRMKQERMVKITHYYVNFMSLFFNKLF